MWQNCLRQTSVWWLTLRQMSCPEQKTVCVCVETDLYHCLIFGLITVRLLVLYQLTREYVRHAGESKAHNLKDCDPTKRICPHWRCR